MNQNEQNYLELKKRFGNGNEVGFENTNENENELGNGFENGLESRNEQRIQINTTIGNELDDTARNELANKIKQELQGENTEDLVKTMKQEHLFFCSDENSFQNLNQINQEDGDVRIIIVTSRNVGELVKRYYNIVEYYLEREYIHKDEVKDFEKAVERLNKLSQVYNIQQREYFYKRVFNHDDDSEDDASEDADADLTLSQKIKRFLYGE